VKRVERGNDSRVGTIRMNWVLGPVCEVVEGEE
jgi:hypothetical protein